MSVRVDMAYPKNPREQFELLTHQAEGYIRRGKMSDQSFKRWRNRAVDWLKQNAPQTSLARELLVVPPNNIRQGFKVLSKAEATVPFIRGQVRNVPPHPANVKKVFVVHGHDEVLKKTVAIFLKRVGLQPVILHNLADRGRTIIEKFTEHSDVGYAVVLLTGDDRGGLATESENQYRFRARQNVILEMGFFLGKIGRSNVAAIYDERVEIPSDYRGVLFVPYDQEGRWKSKLIREFKGAGIPVDLKSFRRTRSS
jgi:predicted nucleotide-binding protein